VTPQKLEDVDPVGPFALRSGLGVRDSGAIPLAVTGSDRALDGRGELRSIQFGSQFPGRVLWP
jgi:hypothetical protein